MESKEEVVDTDLLVSEVHKVWSEWMKNFLEKVDESQWDNDTVILKVRKEDMKRWKEQMVITYPFLPYTAKIAVRAIAERYLKHIHACSHKEEE